jgi:hypothetical protein
MRRTASAANAEILIPDQLTAVISGSVMTVLFSQLSDCSDKWRFMTMNYLPLIATTAVLLVIPAFAAEASSP